MIMVFQEELLTSRKSAMMMVPRELPFTKVVLYSHGEENYQFKIIKEMSKRYEIVYILAERDISWQFFKHKKINNAYM